MVPCPTCGHPNQVPGEQPSAAAAAMAAMSRLEQGAGAPAFDDVPALVADQGQEPNVASPPVVVPSSVGAAGGAASPWSAPVIRSTPPSSGRAGSSQTVRQAPNMEDALLLITRRAVYAQAGLLLLVAALAFVAGYLIGRGNQSSPKQAVPAASPADNGNASGHSGSFDRADGNAVIIGTFLPRLPHASTAVNPRSPSADRSPESRG